MKEIYAYPTNYHTEIDDKIKAILAKGHVACFTNIINGTIKYVTEWNQDADGDLTASLSTGQSKYICPYAIEYKITEIEKLP